MLSLVLIPLSIVIFLKLNRQYQFIVFSIAALYPCTLGNLRSIPSLLVIEWLTIIAFISLMNQLIPVYTSSRRLSSFKFKGTETFLVALLVLAIWVIVSLVNNEILAEKIVTGESTGTKRAYFDIFNNILIFFTTIIFFVSQSEKINLEKALRAILYATILIGIIRTVSFYLKINTPLLGGIFDYNPSSSLNRGFSAQRLLGLDYVAAVGIPALFGLYVFKNKLNFKLLFIILVFLFLSGSRTTMIGVTISIIIFSIIFLPKNLVYFIIGGGIMFALAVILLPQSFLEAKFARLSTLHEVGFMGQDIWRGTTWKFFLKNFQSNPVFGKGIGDYGGFIYSTFPGTEEFVRQQMVSGGHGSYLSLLGILGIGGVMYFVLMMFGGIILAFKKVKQYIPSNKGFTAIGIFCFMLLINLAMLCITGFNGLTDIQPLFYLVGFICAIRIYENRPPIPEY